MRGRENLERDVALLTLHANGGIGDILRFHRYAPTALVGRFQAIAREIRTGFCAEKGIDVVRRPTGGGALYLDEGIQCFSLVVRSRDLGVTLAERLQAGARMIAAALSHLGITSLFKAPNDLEVDGRKIASVFLTEEGPSSLLTAVVPVTLDIATAMKALLVPTEKLTITGLERAQERMTSLAGVLGRIPGDNDLCAALAQGVADILGTPPMAYDIVTVSDLVSTQIDVLPEDGWPDTAGNDGSFETLHKQNGATLRLCLKIKDEAIEKAWFATDAQIAPSDFPERLCAAMQGNPLSDLATVCRTFLDGLIFDATGFDRSGIVHLAALAQSKWRLNRKLGLSLERLSGLMLAGAAVDSSGILDRAGVMLVPYCAKPVWCKWRHTTECGECGKCAVGDAYRLARERNMAVITITNFEHLTETFRLMRKAGVTAYVGSCCGHFFLKRHQAFAENGMNGVLLDIVGSTCYELNEEHLAYAGKFTAEAKLDGCATIKLMQIVPSRVSPLHFENC